MLRSIAVEWDETSYAKAALDTALCVLFAEGMDDSWYDGPVICVVFPKMLPLFRGEIPQVASC
jgi:hypothetical protein